MSDQLSRTYRHKKCGALTTVSDDTLDQVCNPWKGVFGTVCAGESCDGGVFSDFVWEDTGESLEDYRNRMQAESPLLLRFVNSGLFTLSAWVAGGVAGWFIAEALGIWRWVGAVVGFFAATQILYWLVVPFLFRVMFRIDYRTRR
jgi:hypothetical protein